MEGPLRVFALCEKSQVQVPSLLIVVTNQKEKERQSWKGRRNINKHIPI